MPSNATTLYIIEPNASGHRLYYLRLLAEAAMADAPGGAVEWVTSREAVSSEQAEVQLGELLARGAIHVRVLDPWPSRSEVLRLFAIDRPAATVSIPDGDTWLVALARSFLTVRAWRLADVRVLCMRPPLRQTSEPYVRGTRTVAKRALICAVAMLGRVARRRWKVFGLVDAFGYSAGDLPRYLTAVRDPIEARDPVSKAKARAILDIGADEIVVGLLGAVHARKNPGAVARGCAAAFGVREGRLLVVGTVSPEAAGQLEESRLPKDRLHIRNSYVSEEELTVAASACDMVTLLYDNHESASGVLALAAQTGTPVLVPTGSRLAALATASGFGIAADVADVSIAAGIHQVIDRHEALSTAALSASHHLGTKDFVTKMGLQPPRP